MPADILTSHFRSVFEDVLSPARQQQAIDSLQDFIYEAQYGTDEQRRDIGVLDDEDTDEQVVEQKLNTALDKCYWQMVMFLRGSKPSMVSCAEPYLRYLLDAPCVKLDLSHAQEILASLHLAAALSAPLSAKTHEPLLPLGLPAASICAPLDDEAAELRPQEERDAEALSLFTRAFNLYDSLSRSRSASPVPFITPLTSAHGVLGLDLCSTPPTPGTPLLAPASPLFAYAVPGSDKIHHLSLERSSSQRLSGVAGKRGKLPPKTELWARASYVRLLRRLDAGTEEHHAEEAARQVDIMRAYVHEHPYALPHDKYDAFLRDLRDEFDVDVGLDMTPHDSVLDVEHSLTHRALEYPRPSTASSCSSSSSASPQTPYTPLLPAKVLASRLHHADDVNISEDEHGFSGKLVSVITLTAPASAGSKPPSTKVLVEHREDADGVL